MRKTEDEFPGIIMHEDGRVFQKKFENVSRKTLENMRVLSETGREKVFHTSPSKRRREDPDGKNTRPA